MKKYFFIKTILSFYTTIGVPLLYLFNIALIYYYANTLSLSFILIILGLLMGIIGIVLWVISFLTLCSTKSFAVLPIKQKRIRRGIYKYFRHPMYIGIWLTLTGLSIADQSKAGLLFANIIILPLLILRAIIEDRYLYN